MDAIENELNKNGISVINKLSTGTINEIAMYVSNALCKSFPELKLNYNNLAVNIAKMPMYIANMPDSTNGASYLYKNSAIYFRKGIKFDEAKKLAVHECIHHFQEIKNDKGMLKRMGLCNFIGSRSYGEALNEASVQMMAAYAIGENKDKVTYYGLTLPTDSPSYYPILCNLIKQIGYITGFSLLFESTFYSNDKFFDRFKELIGDKNAYKIQENFEKILKLENEIGKINYRIQNEELAYHKFKNQTDKMQKDKDNIQKTFLDTQTLILTSFFNKQIEKITNVKQIESYRKYLYSFINLIGTTPSYGFFNDFYIKKMIELDNVYGKLTGNESLVVVKKSKLQLIIESLKNIITGNAREYEKNKF